MTTYNENVEMSIPADWVPAVARKPTSYSSGANMNHPPKTVVNTAAGRLTCPVARSSCTVRPANTNPRTALEVILPRKAADAPATTGVTPAAKQPTMLTAAESSKNRETDAYATVQYSLLPV